MFNKSNQIYIDKKSFIDNRFKEMYNIDENYYYVYEHHLDEEIIYVGKGKGMRAYTNGRNEYWDLRVGNRINEVEVNIVGYFEKEEDAFFFERLLIRKRVSEGYNLCNIIHNGALKKYLSNESKIRKDYSLKEEKSNKIDEAIRGKVYINKNRSFNMKDSSILSHKFEHIEQTGVYIESLSTTLKYSEIKTKGFAACKTINSQLRLAEIVRKAGMKPLVLWSPYNRDKPMSKKQLKFQSYVIKTGRIPDEFDFLIINSIQKDWNIKDSRIKLVIINTIEKTEVANVLSSIFFNPDTLVYRSAIGNSDYYVNFPDEFLNTLLSAEDKRNLIEELNIRNNKGNLIGWGKMKKILTQQGYKIEETRRRIDGKITRLSTVCSTE